MLGFSLSVSGIQVGMRRLNVAANNIANSTTPSFKASRVDSVDIRHGGAAGTVNVNGLGRHLFPYRPPQTLYEHITDQ